MSNPVSVKWFASTMTGAPVMSGQAGALIGVLDACLLADGSGGGFNTVTLNSLVVASSVATATVNTGHGFTDYTVVKVAGATPSGLNGDKRITVTGTNTFTFDATGISDQTATGTITAKMAPLGWVKSYSDTNKAAYSRSSAQATAMLLRVDDTGTTSSTWIMYEAMTTIDSGTGLAPTSGSIYIGKSTTANSTARPWRLYADDQMFYLFVDQDSTGNWTGGGCFGDVIPYKSGDAYHCYICGGQREAPLIYLGDFGDVTANAYFSRAWHQTGVAVASARYSHRKCQYTGQGTQEFPCFTDNALHVWPVEAWESTTRARGLMPGLYCPVHATGSIAEGTNIITNVASLSNATIKIQGCYVSRFFGINLTGPWR